MADDKTPNETNPTYSVRTTKEVSDKIQELLIKTGLSSKDLFTTMVENLETKFIIETSPEQNQSMQQIRYHLARVDSVFLGMAQKVVDVTEDFALRFESQALKQQEIVDRLSQEKVELIKEATIVKETVDNITEKLERSDEQLSELNERAKADKLTISILGQKIEILEKDVQSVPVLTELIREHEKRIHILKTDLDKSTEEYTALGRELGALNLEKVRLMGDSEKQLSLMDREHEQILITTIHEHEQEIKRLTEVGELKIQHVILQIETEVSKAKQGANNEQLVLMREYNQLIKEHAMLREKYAVLIPRKTT